MNRGRDTSMKDEKALPNKEVKTLTRAKLADTIQDKYGEVLHLSRQSYGDIIDAFFDEICQSLIKGESVKLSSFGSFLIRQKKERIGRNPKTGINATITQRKVVTFRPSQYLKIRINSSKQR